MVYVSATQVTCSSVTAYPLLVLGLLRCSTAVAWLNPLRLQFIPLSVVSSRVAQSSQLFHCRFIECGSIPPSAIPLSVVSSHVAQSSQSYPRFLVRTSSIKALDHAPQLFHLDFTFSVSSCYSSQASLQSILVPSLFFAHLHSSLFVCCGSSVFGKHFVVADAPLLANILDQDPRILRIRLIHGYRHCPPRVPRQTLSIRYSRYRYPSRSTEHIPLSLVSPYATDSITPLSYGFSNSSAQPLASSKSFIWSLLRIVVVPRITSQTTASKPRWSSPLERAYCHERLVRVALATPFSYIP
jgi:hypothetical protein